MLLELLRVAVKPTPGSALGGYEVENTLDSAENLDYETENTRFSAEKIGYEAG